MGKLGALLNTTVGFTVEAASALSHSSQTHPLSSSNPYTSASNSYPTSHHSTMPLNTPCGLPLPVIIPQRRPQNKSRGWARAYAPALLGAGIDEGMFLAFIDRFNEESKASPYLHVVNVAGAGIGFIPGITPMLVSMAIPVAVSAAKKAQSKRQSESYLDKANASLFIPHGLYAIVMTYNPKETSDTLDVDVSSSSDVSILPYRNPSPYYSSPETQRAPALTLPDSCPLVFADPAPPQTLDPSRNGFLKFGDFVSDFKDRRAQASFAQGNSDSTLVGPMPVFKSKYADPGYGSSGSSSSPATVVEEETKKPGRLKAMKEKIMHSDVMYLMIVNNTTDREDNALPKKNVRPYDLPQQHVSERDYQTRQGWTPSQRREQHGSGGWPGDGKHQLVFRGDFSPRQMTPGFHANQERCLGDGVVASQWEGSYEQRMAPPPLPPRTGPPPRYTPYERDEYRESGGKDFCVPTL